MQQRTIGTGDNQIQVSGLWSRRNVLWYAASTRIHRVLLDRLVEAGGTFIRYRDNYNQCFGKRRR